MVHFSTEDLYEIELPRKQTQIPNKYYLNLNRLLTRIIQKDIFF